MSLAGGISSSSLVTPVASVKMTVAEQGVGPAGTRLVGSLKVLRRSSGEREVIPSVLWVEASPVYGCWDWWGCW